MSTLAEMEAQAQCAHVKISWRTEDKVYDGPDIPGDTFHPPLKSGTILTRGWWECDSGCGTHFIPLAPWATRKEVVRAKPE